MMKKILFLSALLFAIGCSIDRCFAQSWGETSLKRNRLTLRVDSTQRDKVKQNPDSSKQKSSITISPPQPTENNKKLETNNDNTESQSSLYNKKSTPPRYNAKLNPFPRKKNTTNYSIPSYYNTYPFNKTQSIGVNIYYPNINKTTKSKTKKSKERNGYTTTKTIINEATKSIGTYQSPYQYSPRLLPQGEKKTCLSCFGSGKTRDFYGNMYNCRSCNGKGKR